jgi:hypothetical protein
VELVTFGSYPWGLIPRNDDPRLVYPSKLPGVFSEEGVVPGERRFWLQHLARSRHGGARGSCSGRGQGSEEGVVPGERRFWLQHLARSRRGGARGSYSGRGQGSEEGVVPGERRFWLQHLARSRHGSLPESGSGRGYRSWVAFHAASLRHPLLSPDTSPQPFPAFLRSAKTRSGEMQDVSRVNVSLARRSFCCHVVERRSKAAGAERSRLGSEEGVVPGERRFWLQHLARSRLGGV